MTLSDYQIRNEMYRGGLTIERPEDKKVDIQPSSADLHLGDEFAYPYTEGNQAVDVTDESTYPEMGYVGGEEIVLEPNDFVLAHTEEYIDLPENICGYLWGKSSIGRLGLFVHNAGLVDANFCGSLVLEVYNAASYPIKLHAGQAICQLALDEQPPATNPYSADQNTYQGQEGVTPSRGYESLQTAGD